MKVTIVNKTPNNIVFNEIGLNLMGNLTANNVVVSKDFIPCLEKLSKQGIIDYSVIGDDGEAIEKTEELIQRRNVKSTSEAYVVSDLETVQKEIAEKKAKKALEAKSATNKETSKKTAVNNTAVNKKEVVSKKEVEKETAEEKPTTKETKKKKAGRPKGSKNKPTKSASTKKSSKKNESKSVVKKKEDVAEKEDTEDVVKTDSDGKIKKVKAKRSSKNSDRDEQGLDVSASLEAAKKIKAEEDLEKNNDDQLNEENLKPEERMGNNAVVMGGQNKPVNKKMVDSIVPEHKAIIEDSPFIEDQAGNSDDEVPFIKARDYGLADPDDDDSFIEH